jgi:hypothetical protein
VRVLMCASGCCGFLSLRTRRQALRAAHASCRFSWQEAADRPCATVGGAQREQAAKQQQQQLLALLQQVELRSNDTTGAAAAAATRDQGPVAPAEGGGRSDDTLDLVSIKPGFYAEQLQRAVTNAAAADAAAAASTDDDAGSSQPMQQQQQAHGCCGGHHHHHSHGEAADVDPLEPSEAEYTAAVREALQQLDGCVAAINDALEEVREAIDDEED